MKDIGTCSDFYHTSSEVLTAIKTTRMVSSTASLDWGESLRLHFAVQGLGFRAWDLRCEGGDQVQTSWFEGLGFKV